MGRQPRRVKNRPSSKLGHLISSKQMKGNRAIQLLSDQYNISLYGSKVELNHSSWCEILKIGAFLCRGPQISQEIGSKSF